MDSSKYLYTAVWIMGEKRYDVDEEKFRDPRGLKDWYPTQKAALKAAHKLCPRSREGMKYLTVICKDNPYAEEEFSYIWYGRDRSQEFYILLPAKRWYKTRAEAIRAANDETVDIPDCHGGPYLSLFGRRRHAIPERKTFWQRLVSLFTR